MTVGNSDSVLHKGLNLQSHFSTWYPAQKRGLWNCRAAG